MLFLGSCLFFNSWDKKLVCLLSLELIMLVLVSMFFFGGFSAMGAKSFFLLFVLLCFMVLDSVLGISILVCTCRSSNVLVSSRGF